MVSIVILSHLRLKCTVSCLESLFLNSLCEYEIIVVEQTGINEHIDRLQQFPVKLVKQKENLGVAKGRNVASEFVTRDYVLFLDNDCTVDKDWDKELFNVLQGYQPDALTCRLKTREGIRNCEFLDYTYGPEICSVDVESEARCTYVRGVSFHKLQTFKELGKFDEGYFIRYEDADYSLRLKGRKTLFTPKVCINHIHSHNNREYNRLRWSKEIKNKSRTYFETKWKEKLEQGEGMILLDSEVPKSLVKKRLDEFQQKKIKYKFFRDSDLLEEVEKIHGYQIVCND